MTYSHVGATLPHYFHFWKQNFNGIFAPGSESSRTFSFPEAKLLESKSSIIWLATFLLIVCYKQQQFLTQENSLTTINCLVSSTNPDGLGQFRNIYLSRMA